MGFYDRARRRTVVRFGDQSPCPYGAATVGIRRYALGAGAGDGGRGHVLHGDGSSALGDVAVGVRDGECDCMAACGAAIVPNGWASSNAENKGASAASAASVQGSGWHGDLTWVELHRDVFADCRHRRRAYACAIGAKSREVATAGQAGIVRKVVEGRAETGERGGETARELIVLEENFQQATQIAQRCRDFAAQLIVVQCQIV